MGISSIMSMNRTNQKPHPPPKEQQISRWKPIVILSRVQDPSPPIQNNFSSDKKNRVNYLNNNPNTAQSRYNLLYSSAAKRYFATITLSPEELDSFRAFIPVIDNFYHFQLCVKNKQRAREHGNQFNYGYE